MAAIQPNPLTMLLRGQWQTVLSLVLMAIVLAVGVPLIFRIKREVAEEEEPITEHDVLSDLEQAHAAGELDDAELRRVRELVREAKAPSVKPKPARPGLPRRGPESASDAGDVPPPADPNEPPSNG